MSRRQINWLAILLPCATCGSLYADGNAYMWTGAARNGQWADSRNWSSDTGECFPGADHEDVAIVQRPQEPGFDVYLNCSISLSQLSIREHSILRTSGHSITLTGHDPLTIERLAQLRLNENGDSLTLVGDGRIRIDGALVIDADDARIDIRESVHASGDGQVTSLDRTSRIAIAPSTTLVWELQLVGSFTLDSDQGRLATFDNRGCICARGFPGLIALGPGLALKDSPGGVRWMASGFGAELQFNRSADAASPSGPSLQGDLAIESWGVIRLGPDVDITTTGDLERFQGAVITDDAGRLRTATHAFRGHTSSLSFDTPETERPKPSP